MSLSSDRRKRKHRRSFSRLLRRAVLLGAAALGVVVVFSLVEALSVRNALVLAEARFRDAQSAAKEGDIDSATRSLDTAESHTRRASRALRGPTFSLAAHLPLVGNEVRSARTVLAGARDASAASSNVLQSLSKLNLDGDTDAGLDVATAVSEASGLRPSIEATVATLRSVHRDTARTRPRARSIRDARDELVSGITEIDSQASAALGLLDLGDALVGDGARHRLLLLGQDDWELRPSGGFIGSWGILEIAHGRLDLVRYEDSTTLPSSSAPAPPTLAVSLNKAWSLTGVGWWSDFPTTAARAREMIREVAGEDVDGVVALTQHAVEELLSIVGPVQVPGYDETIDKDNVAERVLYHVELKRPRDVPRKRFLSGLADVAFTRLSDLQGRAAVSFLNAVAEGSQRRDAQVWFADRRLQQLGERAGLDGGLRVVPPREDYLSVVDANIGSDKANRNVTSAISYRVRSDRGGLVGEVEVATTNVGPDSNVNHGYHSFVRVTVPMGSVWLGPAPDDVVSKDRDGPYQTFGLGDFVPVGKTVTRVFRYRLPATVVADGYRLTYQGQAGVDAETSIDVRTGKSQVRKRLSGRGSSAVVRAL